MKKTFAIILALICVFSLFLSCASAAVNVVLSPQNLSVDGKAIECEKYNIDGYNYFKLRDIAYLLNGTGSQFEVSWNANTSTVCIVPGNAYSADGSELVAGADKSSTAVSSSQTIIINGKQCTDLSVFNLGGNNYFKLRDLGEAIGFSVDYDASTNTAIVKSEPYSSNEVCYFWWNKLSVGGTLKNAIDNNPNGIFKVLATYRPTTADITSFEYKGKTLSEWATAAFEENATQEAIKGYKLAFNAYLDTAFPIFIDQLSSNNIQCEKADYMNNGLILIVSAQQLKNLPLEELGYWTFDLCPENVKGAVVDFETDEKPLFAVDACRQYLLDNEPAEVIATITNYETPSLKLIDELPTRGTYLKVTDEAGTGPYYVVTYTTTSDGMLGPIEFIVNQETQIVGLYYRE